MPKNKNTCVYVVKQYQPQEDYNGEIIYIYTNEEDAIQAARNLNKTYGENCIFDMDGDHEQTLNEDCHFYLVEACIIDDHIPEQEKYYDYFVVKAGRNFIGENDTIVEKAKDAMKFNSWDEARSMIKVFQSLDICEGLPLYVQGM